MQAPFDNIVQHLFHQPSLHSVTVDELENMAQKHPYFAAAHFLLLKKMQDTNHPQFNTQLHKTTLYFNNPLWLQYLLQPETVADFTVSENAPFISDKPAVIFDSGEQSENGHTNGHATATAYQLKEKEVLLEKAQTPVTIDEPFVEQQTDLPQQHSNGGIMDVITEVFNDEHNNAIHLPVFEEPVINTLAAVDTAEATVNDNETIETTGSITVVEPETIIASAEVQEHEAEKFVEPNHEVFTNGDNATYFHEGLTEDVVETGEIKHDTDAYQVADVEQENTPGENTIGEETTVFANEETIEVLPYEETATPVAEVLAEETHTIAAGETTLAHAVPENNYVAEESAHVIPDEISTGANTVAVEEAHSALEEVNSGSFNEDVTASVIATIEENNGTVDFHAEKLSTSNPEEISSSIAPEKVEEPLNEHSSVIASGKTDAQSADDTDKAEVSKDAMPDQERPLFRTVIETPASKHDFLFEPYHTVDYFASQGIKLSKLEAYSKDKLGTQLKSFTEWLKSMKKLPQASIDKILSENEESKVVADAFNSIEKKDVITEAMAEVFEKQGMLNEAAGVYQKLSLLNPAKSAYFAAKIEALKH